MPDKKKILVVSGTPAGRTYLSIIFNRLWYSSLPAKSVSEGMSLAEKYRPSLIVFDNDLPKDRFRSAITILRREEWSRNIPLVVVSMRDAPGERDEILALGCSAILSKPVDLTEAYEVLSGLTGEQRQHPRVPILMAVEAVEGTTSREMTCVNISEGGMHLRSPSLLPEQAILHLAFMLPSERTPSGAVVQVVRIVSADSGLDPEPGMGVRFVELPEIVRMQIRRYVDRKILGDLQWDPDLSTFRFAEDV